MKLGWNQRMGISLATAALVVTGCSTSSPQGSTKATDVEVSAAASLVPLLNDVKQVYEADHKGVHLVVNTAGTQVLTTQIEQGAPADLLISARQKDVDTLKNKGLVDQSEHIASNELVLILSPEGAKKIKTAQDLTQSGVRLVLGEEASPIGEYSRNALKKMDATGTYGDHFLDRVMKNVVSNESNEQNVLSKVLLGEADAGLVYRTSLQEEKAKGHNIGSIAIDSSQNVRTDYFLVRLHGISAGGEEFAKWLESDKGKELLKKHGYLL